MVSLVQPNTEAVEDAHCPRIHAESREVDPGQRFTERLRDIVGAARTHGRDGPDVALGRRHLGGGLVDLAG